MPSTSSIRSTRPSVNRTRNSTHSSASRVYMRMSPCMSRTSCTSRQRIRDSSRRIGRARRARSADAHGGGVHPQGVNSYSLIVPPRSQTPPTRCSRRSGTRLCPGGRRRVMGGEGYRCAGTRVVPRRRVRSELLAQLASLLTPQRRGNAALVPGKGLVTPWNQVRWWGETPVSMGFPTWASGRRHTAVKPFSIVTSTLSHEAPSAGPLSNTVRTG